METKIKAVKDLMNTLGVTIEDLISAEEKTETENGLKYIVDKETRLQYVEQSGKVIGVFIECFLSARKNFIVALGNGTPNNPKPEAEIEARKLPTVNGNSWDIPTDEHCRTIVSYGNASTNKVNILLRKLGGTPLQGEYLTKELTGKTAYNVRYIVEV